MVVAVRAHCFHDNVHITPILLLWDLSTLCVMDHLWLLILRPLLRLFRAVWFTDTSVTVHHVPKCINYHKAIVVITGTAHYFHDYMYKAPILLLRDLSTLCVVDHLWLIILRSLLSLLSTFWFISTRKHHVFKYVSCRKAIVVKTVRVYIQYIYIYIT